MRSCCTSAVQSLLAKPAARVGCRLAEVLMCWMTCLQSGQRKATLALHRTLMGARLSVPEGG